MKPVKSIQDYLLDEQTYTTVLLVILFNEYGSEFLDWDPSTIALQIKDDFKVEISQLQQDKINSGVALFASNAFFVSLEAFVAIANSLSFDVIDSELFMPADLEECMWAIIEARLLMGKKDFESEEFIEDIKRYVGLLMSEEGLYMPPASLNFAIYPDGVLENTAGAFTDDPLMYSVYTEKQDRTKQELELYVQSRLMALLVQLKNLPIKELDKTIVENMLAGVAASIQSLNLPLNEKPA